MPTFQQYKSRKAKSIQRNSRRIIDHGDWFIYPSTAPHSSLAHHTINGEFKDKANQTIECRHLSHAWLLHQKRKLAKHRFNHRPPNQSYYARLFSNQELVASISSLHNNDFDKKHILERAARYTTLELNGNSLGSQLHTMHSDLHINERRYLLILSENHAMAAIIERKSNPNRFIVNFYDPNFSSMHFRAVFNSSEALKKLTIQILISSTVIQTYFPTIKSMVISEYPNPNTEAMLLPNSSKQFANTRPITTQSDVEVFHLLYHAVLLRRRIDIEKSLSELIKRKAYDLLNTHIDNQMLNGKTIVQYALSDNNTEVVCSIMQVLLNLHIDEAVLLNIFGNQAIDGCHGLHSTIRDGHSKSTLVVIVTILASKLSDDAKASLISAPDADGTPALHAAYATGNTKMVVALNQIILSSGLSREHKLDLLSAKNAAGTPGLHAALQVNRPVTIFASMQTILDSCLSIRDKLHLLRAKSNQGTPALYTACNLGNKEAVMLYNCRVLLSTLPDINKLLLIIANNINQETALAASVRQGHTETAHRSLRQYLHCKLPEEYKTKRMEHEFGREDSCLASALDHGHYETVEAIIEELTRHQLGSIVPESIRQRMHETSASVTKPSF